jgi:hypothetical protein
MTSDVVLNVADTVRWAGGLGSDVHVFRVADAVHDLALSASPARAHYFGAVRRWLGAKSLDGAAGHRGPEDGEHGHLSQMTQAPAD